VQAPLSVQPAVSASLAERVLPQAVLLVPEKVPA
jgi:hypothetical protein